ncbi:MAG TPA: FHA domain-containing protein [Candidatus Hydrogenedentes bacterium]|nr:FHA domain-containing protein [Candidatus Hydrogenedentota bacterium]HQM48509.1 FHA domain-containing protein [Candidatus Hydrogenedentota bacterium]
MKKDPQKIRITWDDVKNARISEPAPLPLPIPGTSQTGEERSWGNISQTGHPTGAFAASGGNVLLKGWFYLGAAGLMGAFLAWLICEPSFGDNVNGWGWGNVLIFPLMVILMSIGFGTAESVVERTWTRALLRGLASTGLGLLLGSVMFVIANIVFNILIAIVLEMGVESETSPLFWVSRSVAWAVFGIAGGLIFGIVSVSGKKTLYGMLGGVIGAAAGGLLFDPIALLTGGAEASRAIGMAILGAGTGVAIGLVESALKDRWLYVSGGPLAGKQFVLYQDHVTLGRSQSNTIYLFKDDTILEQHAVIEHRAGRSLLTAYGQLVVSGQLLHPGMQHMLRNGDVLQIGRYVFTYAERERAARP